MIVIRAVTYNGLPCQDPLSAEFDETGGSIGRAVNNHLVLPDSEHLISRVQATIAFRNGGYVLLSQGRNPVHLNDCPIAIGNSVRLSDGDEMQIGGYSLKVLNSAPERSISANGQPVDDPLTLFGTPGLTKSDPFADLLLPGPRVPPVSASPGFPQVSNLSGKAAQSVSSVQKQMGKLIPEDFDPFADPFALRPVLPDATALGGLPGDFDPCKGQQQNIDTLFGLKATSGHSPFAGTPLDVPAQRSDGLDGANSLLDLAGSSSGLTYGPIPDQVPEVNAAFQSPRALLVREQMGELSTERSDADGAFFLSWESENRCGETAVARTIIQPASALAPPSPDHPKTTTDGASAELSAPSVAKDKCERMAGATTTTEPNVFSAPSGSNGVAHQLPAIDQSARETQQVGEYVVAASMGEETERSANDKALLRSFIIGLGAPDLVLSQGMTQELMEQVGRLLREATQGTLDLLVARAITKSEMRGSVTIIAGIDNNPLKFSPNVGIALANLLSPHPGRGFMPPVEAMRDAYDDLRSHQFGFMAGMRAALAGVLQRFNPEDLEKRLKENRVLDNLVPMSRKARLWELFSELYGQISLDAEEDFHTLFSKEFLRAYEEQVARLCNQEERKP